MKRTEVKTKKLCKDLLNCFIILRHNNAFFESILDYGFFEGEPTNENSRAEKALIAAKELLKHSPDQKFSLKTNAGDGGKINPLVTSNTSSTRTHSINNR